MKEAILHEDLSSEFFIEERCYITELTAPGEDPDLSIARARVEPGVTTHWHRLRGAVERYYILRGQGTMEVGDLPSQTVNPGDMVIIPPMCRQRITNTGSQDLIFLAICTPRFLNEIYEDMEEKPGLK